MGRTFKHLTFEQRVQIKQMIDNGYRKTDIAAALGIHNATIYREIERGSVNGVYDPSYSEDDYRKNLRKKGAKPLLAIKPELAEHIAHMILVNRLSPTQIIRILQSDAKFESYPKSRITIYNAIDSGLIPNVTRDSLKSDITTVFSDGTIHIAKWVRDELCIKDGDELFFEVVDGKIIFSKNDILDT